MLKVGLCLPDDGAPRTEYWDKFIKALKRSTFFSKSGVDLLIPSEDTAIETNWPRYANAESAYIRGKPHDLSNQGQFIKYFERIISLAKSNPNQIFLYLNMHPFFRAPVLLRQLKNMIVADGSLAMYERDLNFNTISMPALPIVYSRSALSGERSIMASFQGVNSHPIRELLKHVANGSTIVVNLVERERHWGKVDAINAKTDPAYEELLANSRFAFVPRGDALFSYRLAEVMSFGCIPIILSDGWILPFDRILPWEQMSLRVHTDAIQHLPQILANFTTDDILSRQKQVISVYASRFANLDAILSGLMAEVEILLR